MIPKELKGSKKKLRKRKYLQRIKARKRQTALEEALFGKGEIEGSHEINTRK